MMYEPRKYDVEVEEVHSGDDLVLLVNLGVDGLYKRVRARLKGVDTPSAFRAAKDTEAGEVRDFMRALVLKSKCFIDLHSSGKGGWMVTLYTTQDDKVLNVNDLLRQKGYVYNSKQEA